jgi:hypothetical protein
MAQQDEAVHFTDIPVGLIHEIKQSSGRYVLRLRGAAQECLFGHDDSP